MRNSPQQRRQRHRSWKNATSSRACSSNGSEALAAVSWRGSTKGSAEQHPDCSTTANRVLGDIDGAHPALAELSDHVIVADKLDHLDADFHTCAVDSVGAVWCWGSNSSG